MFIPRKLEEEIKCKILDGRKIIIVYGPRQVGKTTVVNRILETFSLKKLAINADERKYADALSSRDLNVLKRLVAGYDLLFVDEAQRVSDIGVNLKILHDNFPDLKIVVTGSSSFDLANKIKEPLTGRTITYNLYPISINELSSLHNDFELVDRLEEFMVYGMYPELLNIENSQDKVEYLKELTTSYLYKDVLDLRSIKHSKRIHDLLSLVAFQAGSQVSVAELGRALSISKDTIDSYIQLLEKAFVLFRLSGYSRNLRKEVTKMDKIYFYDTGVRNTIIDNLKPLRYRDDHGKLWENFLIVERKKLLSNSRQSVNDYFWRTYTGAEIDYVEERQGRPDGFEFKFGGRMKKCPRSWRETYPGSSFTCVNRENFLDFALGKIEE
jgi:uncharacterized protein